MNDKMDGAQMFCMPGAASTDPSWLLRGLSLDGGGLFGLIQTLQAAEIEKRTQKTLAEQIHMMAGTSFGGLHAIALSINARTGRPFLTAQQFHDLILDRYQEIFVPTLTSRFNLDYVFDATYSSEGLKKVVQEVVGDARLSDVANDLLVTSYDTKRGKPVLFKSWQARGDLQDSLDSKRSPQERDFSLVDIAMATTAAPTYFRPHTAKNMQGKTHLFIDGAIAANHPATLLKNAILKRYGAAYRPFILSIGTGMNPDAYKYCHLRRRGKAGWIRPALDFLMDSQLELVDYDLRKALGATYMRMQTPLSGLEGLPDVDFGFDIRSVEELEIVLRYGENLRDNIAAQDHTVLERFFRDQPLRPISDFMREEIALSDPLIKYRSPSNNNSSPVPRKGQHQEETPSLPKPF